MPSDRLTVFIIDDDAAVRDSLALRLGIEGYRTALFADAEAFLSAVDRGAGGCVVADVKLPGASGLELQAELQRRGIVMPVVIITAHGDVASARTAFQAKAIDFLPKPFDTMQLLSAVSTAFEREEARLKGEAQRREETSKLSRLTAREREVLDRVAEGLHAKEIAARMGISPRTVEVHKARIMEKLDARNVAELVRLAVRGSP
ncbi:MAG TPA: response regulator [Usitatibacter sp.]|nr:response regulator [Usitatibacter sp.]